MGKGHSWRQLYSFFGILQPVLRVHLVAHGSNFQQRIHILRVALQFALELFDGFVRLMRFQQQSSIGKMQVRVIRVFSR